ncbi:Fumitremorgin C synthase [Leucoagaricus sp. SymC.cos]|nr:Fumitremorgin C synthase [Leucoagaricus sp. SymC.cos]
MDFVHFGKPTIVLSTPKAAIDLLEKRGSIYSSRPRNVFAGEICYRNAKGSLQREGTKLKKFRTLMSATLGVGPSKEFRPLEETETKLMLRGLVLETEAENYRHHIQRSVHSVAFCTTYGQRIDQLTYDHIDFYTALEKFFVAFSITPRRSRMLLTYSSLVKELFPILLRLPRALQWFRKEADVHGDREERFYRTVLDEAKAAHIEGNALSGSVHRALAKQERFGFTDLEVALTSAAPYSAGVSTTLGSCDAFLLAILLFPETMKKAQKELDAVVGPGRMPDFQDLNSLPYIRAMVKETLRWHPFVPLGIPHCTTEDDVYEGMFIPAGSTVIANIYAITRNAELFPDPEEYRPERFLETTNPLLQNYTLTFGFGRRICPGQYVASDQLFLLISRLLWAFDVKPLKGDIKFEAQHGRFGPVTSLPYELVPRSDGVRSVILEQAAIAENDVKAWQTFDFEAHKA